MPETPTPRTAVIPRPRPGVAATVGLERPGGGSAVRVDPAAAAFLRSGTSGAGRSGEARPVARPRTVRAAAPAATPGPRLGHVRALDGLRGLAVALVLLYHGDASFARGGHLGVTVFFTLSGFLITSLLLIEHHRSGRIALRRFWGRRARRLVPALLVCLPLVALLVRLSPDPPSSRLVGDAVAGMLWLANWRFISGNQSYGDLFSLPSPFQHFWSLAVEEQYYLFFPVLAAVLLRVRGRAALAALLGQLVVVSTALAILLGGHALTPTRAYYGTDTRIAEILVGALLALALVRGDQLRPVAARLRPALDAAALVALGVLALLVNRLPYGDPRLFRGGLIAAALCTAVLVAAAVQPGSVARRALEVPGLPELGRVSYGVYLFHWPLFLLLNTGTTGLHGAGLFGVRVTSTLAVAVASFFLVEQPVRQSRTPLLPMGAAWASGATAGILVIALAAGVLHLPAPPTLTAQPDGPAVTGTSGPVPAGANGRAPSTVGASSVVQPGVSTSARNASGPATSRSTTTASRPRRGAGIPPEFMGTGQDYTNPPPPPSVPPKALKVMVIGDSIGNNLGRGLVAWSQGRSDVAVYNMAIPACSISRGGQRRVDPDHLLPLAKWCPWWSDSSTPRYRAMKAYAPKVVFIEDGINALFDRWLSSWSNWESPGQVQFDNWMTSEYQAFVNQYRQLGATVVIGNAPCGDWDNFFHTVSHGPQRVRDLNQSVYPAVLSSSSAGLFNEVCPNGQYSDTVDGVPNARPDGFHFTDEAATALARDWLGPMLLKAGKSPIGLTGG